MIWVFYVALSHEWVAVSGGSIDARLIQEQIAKKELPPPPPPPDFVPSTPEVVMPIVVVASDGDNTATIAVNALRVPKVEAPPPRADVCAFGGG